MTAFICTECNITLATDTGKCHCCKPSGGDRLMTDKCKICGDTECGYYTQIGSNTTLLFCPGCSPILAKGLKLLCDAGEIELKFRGYK